MAKKKNRIEDLGEGETPAELPAAAAIKPTAPAMTFIERHQCPNCESLVNPAGVTNKPWLDDRYHWRRTLIMLCEHCNKGTRVELIYNGAGGWIHEETKTVTALEAAAIAKDIATREEKRAHE